MDQVLAHGPAFGGNGTSLRGKILQLVTSTGGRRCRTTLSIPPQELPRLSCAPVRTRTVRAQTTAAPTAPGARLRPLGRDAGSHSPGGRALSLPLGRTAARDGAPLAPRHRQEHFV
ncbi:hypothetical protein [Streptomyces sp. ICN988]|uniref:hypothetical protein n=1 Tax=Streptomyces sp. ICN988 TaxID=2983765 RepID=UPI00398D0193